MKHSANSTSGSALLLALIILVGITASVAAVLGVTLTDNRAVAECEDNAIALNIAEQALQTARYELADKLDTGSDGIGRCTLEDRDTSATCEVSTTVLTGNRRELRATAVVGDRTVTLREIIRLRDALADFSIYGKSAARLGSWVTVRSGFVGNGAPTSTIIGVDVADHCRVLAGIKGEGPLRFASGSTVIEPVEDSDFGAITINRDARLATHTRVDGDVNVGQDALFADDVEIDGNVVAGGEAKFTQRAHVTAGHTATSYGTPVSFVVPEMPTPTTPTPGTADILSGSAASVATMRWTTIPPGQYKRADFGRYNGVTLRTGVYHFDSFNMAADNLLRFDVTNGPVEIYVRTFFKAGQYLSVRVSNNNGGTWRDPAGNPAVQQLASKIWVEAHGVGVHGSDPIFSVGHHSQWMGTAYVPSDRNHGSTGAEEITIYNDTTVWGALWTKSWMMITHRCEINLVPPERYSPGRFDAYEVEREAWFVQYAN